MDITNAQRASVLVHALPYIQRYTDKMVYAWVDDNMPNWAKPTVTKLMRKGYLKGDNEGKLMLDDNMLRILVINDRAGIYGE